MNSGRSMKWTLTGIGLLMAALAVVVLSGTASATCNGDCYSSGNWVINQPTTVTGMTVNVSGNINIFSTLTLTNSTIQFMTDGNTLTVYGASGGLTMGGISATAAITTADDTHHWFMDVQNSTSNVNVRHTTLTRVQDGVTVTGGTASSRFFDNVTIIDAQSYGFRLLNSYATLQNVNVTVVLAAVITRDQYWSNYSYIYNFSSDPMDNWGYEDVYGQITDYINAQATGVYVSGGGPYIDGVETHVPSTEARLDIVLEGHYSYISDWRNYYQYYYGTGQLCDDTLWYAYYDKDEYINYQAYPSINFYGVYAENVRFAQFHNVRPPPEKVGFDVHWTMNAYEDDEYLYCGVYQDYVYNCDYCAYWTNNLYWDTANVVGIFVKNGGLGNSFTGLDLRMGESSITITSDWNAPQWAIDDWMSYYARFPTPSALAFWSEEDYALSSPSAVTPVDFSLTDSSASGGGVRFDRFYTYSSSTATVFRGSVLVDNITASDITGTALLLNISADSTGSRPSYDFTARVSNTSLEANRAIDLALPNRVYKSTDYQASVLFENNTFANLNMTPDPLITDIYTPNDPCIGQYSYKFYTSDYNGIVSLDTGTHCQKFGSDLYKVDVAFRNNIFDNLAGPVFGWEYSDFNFQGGASLTFDNNDFSHIHWYTAPLAGGGMSSPMVTDAMFKTIPNNVTFSNNRWSDIEVVMGLLGGSVWAGYAQNPAYYGFAYCPYLMNIAVYYQYYGYYGCSFPMKTPNINVSGNIFDDIRTAPVTMGLQSLFMLPGRGYMSFTDNTVANSKATFIHANENYYGVKYPVEDIDVTVARNTITNQSGNAFVTYNDPYKGGMPVRLIDNDYSDSRTPLFGWGWGYFLNSYPQYRPVENLATIVAQGNTLTNLALGGKGALQLTGRSTLLNNSFDTVIGWAVIVEMTSRLPNVAGNDIVNSTNGYWFAPISSSGLRTTSIYSDLRIAVSDTAIRMVNGNLILLRMDFTGAQTAIDMKSGFAEIYSSKIIVLSGKASGDATITAYNDIGYSVRWANAQGIDSGVTVSNALVVTSTPDSRILTSGRTEPDGHINPKTTQVWKITSVGSTQVNELYLPLKIVVSAGGISQTSDLPQLAPGARLTYFEDYPAYPVLLIDAIIPTISIASPTANSAVGSLTVNVEGYTFERGSGIASQRLRVDGGAWLPLPTTTGYSWKLPIVVSGEGEHLLGVEVVDVAGNEFSMETRFSVDVTAPTLTLQRPLEATTLTRQPVFAVQGHVDPADSHVTVNGVPVTVTSRGDFFYNFTLTDGLNVLFVAARDAAGNEVLLVRTLMFDRYPPFLQVNAPVDRLLTNSRTVDVIGRTETGAAVTVNGFAAFVNPVTGSFELPNVVLDTLFAQTENLLVIRAVDRAGNVAYENRTVVADTTAPSIELDLDSSIRHQVEAGLPVSASSIDVRGRTDSTDAKLTIAGQEIQLVGLSFSRVIVLAEGLNLIPIRAMDAAGNERALTLSVVRDSVRPLLVLEHPSEPSLLTNQTSLEITGYTDTEGSVVTIIYTDARGVQNADPVPTVAVGTPIKYRFEYTLQLVTDGNEQPVEVRASDAAGNYASKTFTYTAKVGKPFLEVVGFKPKVTETFMWINGTTEKGIDKVTINGQTFDVVDQFFAVRWNLPITEGNYTVTVSIRDDAGNQNSFQGRTEVAVPSTGVYTPPPAGGIPTEVLVGGVMALLGASIAVLFFALSRRRETE